MVDKRAVLSTLLTIAAVVALVKVSPLMLHTDTPLAVVSSWSMEPTLHVGDLIVVANWGDVKVGDIIVYVDGRGSLIVHRVVAIRHSAAGILYVTKGDANPLPDAVPVPPSRVKGKVILVVPYIGVVKLAFEQLIG